MCGIAGIAGLKDERIDKDILQRMVSVLGHRGPDDEGLYLSRRENPNTNLKVGLGHKRLSIIDLEGGHQPMANEDKTVWIIHNGEVYNFPDLREELLKKGHRFTTKSDTEVIIHLYEEKGIDCLRDLRGMFAFAIWDVKKNRLFLARDRAGKKPLFYFYKDGLFLFASEIKAMLEGDFIKRELDLKSLDKYLTYGYVPSPDTMFKNVKKLPPAHYLLFDGKDLKTERYWSLSYKNKSSLSFAESKERLYELLSEATRIRLISDVPLGVFLSGGVDSSCVVALMARLSPAKVKTFSVGFREEDYDELRYARFISERFGTDHKELMVEPDALDVLPKLVWHYDEPAGDSSCIPTYYVSKMTREFVKVALNGDGGDESFAGYNRYKGIKLARYIKHIPKFLLKAGYGLTGFAAKNFGLSQKSVHIDYARRFLGEIVTYRDIKDIYVNWLNYFTAAQKERLYSQNLKSFLKGKRPALYLHDIIDKSDAANLVEKIINADVMSYLPEDLLVKADRATMANSLEGRSPFLDHKVMEFAASLPLNYKLKGFHSKYILKEIFKKEIPLSFLNRRKKGFGVPIGRWFSTDLKDYVREMLLDKRSLKRNLFSKDYLKGLLDSHQEGREDHTQRIWALLSFEMWHRRFIEAHRI